MFYGAFKGREKIAEMIDDWFHRTARDFRWEMHRPVSDGKMLYAYYTFSYVSTLPEAKGKRVGFEGVSMMTLQRRQDRRVPRGRQCRPGLRRARLRAERTSKILAKKRTHSRRTEFSDICVTNAEYPRIADECEMRASLCKQW